MAFLMVARVLILDDEPTAAEIVTFHLSLRGLQVHQIHDAPTAFAHLCAQKADLLVTDWMMPGQDGRQLINQIRKNPQIGKLPIIVLTAKDLTLEEREFLLAQNCLCLQKPFDPVVLFEKISEALT